MSDETLTILYEYIPLVLAMLALPLVVLAGVIAAKVLRKNRKVVIFLSAICALFLFGAWCFVLVVMYDFSWLMRNGFALMCWGIGLFCLSLIWGAYQRKMLQTITVCVAGLLLFTGVYVFFLGYPAKLVFVGIIMLFCGIGFFCLRYNPSIFGEKTKPYLVACSATALVVASGCIFGTEAYNYSLPEISESYEDVYLGVYEPFRPDTLAKSLDAESTLRLHGNLPRLDGATALYPLYSAFARATYPEGDYSVYASGNPDGQEVVCSRTSEAFERLLGGSADVVFLMGVSDVQLERAKELGLELRLTPIGREAFVFFVNKRNPVSELSADDIRGIYSGEIYNWVQVGGKISTIQAYQRPGSSGSQIMLHEIMGDIPLAEAPEKAVFRDMLGLYMAVASYKNHKSAFGFSFLYYINDMIAEDEIKFIAVDGIMPTTANIANGTYPFSHDFYAITVIREPETEADEERMQNVDRFIDWILSQQGQGLVEKTGYVPLLSKMGNN